MRVYVCARESHARNAYARSRECVVYVCSCSCVSASLFLTSPLCVYVHIRRQYENLDDDDDESVFTRFRSARTRVLRVPHDEPTVI